MLSSAGCGAAGEEVSAAAASGGVDTLHELHDPIDLFVLLDVSESMTRAQRAASRDLLRHLIDSLAPQDRFALLTFGDDARLVVEPERASPSARREWLASLERLRPEGKTNISAALELATSVQDFEGASWIVLSDGFPHWGDTTYEGLRRRLSPDHRLWTIGVGGRVNEELLRALAAAGGGSYLHLDDPGVTAATLLREATASQTAKLGPLSFSREFNCPELGIGDSPPLHL